MKYQAYEEYKDSGVELISKLPASWRILRGKFVFTEYSVRSVTGKETLLSVSEYYGVKPRGDVIDKGDFLSRAESLVDYKKCEKNDLVMNIMLAWKRGLGVTKYDGIVSPAYSVFRFSENVSSDYMHYLLRTDTYTGHFKTRSTGVIDSRLRLYPESFGNVPILLPSTDEQETIANFLDHETAKIDALIEKQQQLIKLLKEKRQAVISHAVTKGLNSNAPMRDSGVEWLGDVPEHWVTKVKLTNVSESNRGSFVNGPFGSDLLACELREDGVPVIYIRDLKRTGYKRKSTVCVTSEKAEQLDVCKVKSGDVLISKVGDPPGAACVYPENEADAIITQDVIRIRVDRNVVTPLFLTMLLNSDFGQMVINDISVEGTRKRVSLGDFKATRFILPELSEQNDIVTYVDDTCEKIDHLIARSFNGVDLIKERRTALISAAVTGKIDVRNWQAPEPSNKNNNKEVAA